MAAFPSNRPRHMLPHWHSICCLPTCVCYLDYRVLACLNCWPAHPVYKLYMEFFWSFKGGGINPHLILLIVSSGYMITKVLYRVFAWDGGNLDYIDIVFTAESRTFVQSSMTFLLFLGILGLQRLAWVLHDRISCRRFICSSLKTEAFLRFHNSQQHRMTNALYWSSGMPLIFWMFCQLLHWRPEVDCMPIADQNWTAIGHWKMMWSGVSWAAPQIRQAGESTIFWGKGLDLHWILPLSCSQKNICTRGGAAFL